MEAYIVICIKVTSCMSNYISSPFLKEIVEIWNNLFFYEKITSKEVSQRYPSGVILCCIENKHGYFIGVALKINTAIS